MTSLSMGAFSPAIIVLFVMTVMAGAVLYLYYLMYKEYKVLINNFEQEQIFVDENVVAFKNIAKISMWILFISLAMSLIGYLAITVLAFIFTNIEPLMRLPIQTNFNGALNMSVFMDFIICVILNISAAVFEKAVKLCKENESNTVL